jgi:hypothetical protein
VRARGVAARFVHRWGHARAAGRRPPAAGRRPPAAARQLPAAGRRLPPGWPPPSTGCWLPAAGRWPPAAARLAAGLWPPAAGCWSPPAPAPGWPHLSGKPGSGLDHGRWRWLALWRWRADLWPAWAWPWAGAGRLGNHCRPAAGLYLNCQTGLRRRHLPLAGLQGRRANHPRRRRSTISLTLFSQTLSVGPSPLSGVYFACS